MIEKNGMHHSRMLTLIIGTLLLVLSALLCISLLARLFALGAVPLAVILPGHVLLSAYGLSSFLVPVMLLFAAVLLLVPVWNRYYAVALAVSPVIFFTVVAGEHIARRAAVAARTGSVAGFAASGVLFSTVLVVAIEYIISFVLADLLYSEKKENPRRVSSVSSAAGTVNPAAFPAMPVESGIGNGLVTGDRADLFVDSAMLGELEAVEAEDFTESETSANAFADADAEKPFGKPGNSVATGRQDAEAGTARDSWAPSPLELEDAAQDDSIFGFDDLPEEDELIESSLPPDDADDFTDQEFDVDAALVDSISCQASDDDTADVVLDFSDEKENASFNDEEPDFGYVSETDDEVEDDVDDDDLDDESEDEFGDEESCTDEDALFGATLDELDPRDSTELEIDDLLSLTPVVTIPPASVVAHTESAAGPVDPVSRSRRRAKYEVPFDILTTYPDGEYWVIDDATRRAAAALKETLNEFRIQADVTGIRKGPVITMFEILPAPGVKLSKIVGLQDNIALRLAASSVRIVAPIPGKHAVGIEVPNQRRAIVSFRELIEADTPSAKKMEIPVVLGKDIAGEAQLLDLAVTPHLLIAGSTGSGKSVCVNSIILSILYKRAPSDVRLLLIDPKIVELKLYNDIPHLLSPVITEPKKAYQALQYCLCEMERRYALLDGMGVRDIKSYNRRIKERNIATEKLPYLVVIIDEFADLMATTGKELESTVARLAAMSRAVGIHLVLATQRPSIDVITGLIKANIPTRIAFMVASKMDSRIIIDQVGAEKLLGRGDLLYASATDPFPVRMQGAYVSEEEVERVVAHVKTLGEPEYIDEEIFFDDEDDSIVEPGLFSDGEDPLYDKALEIVLLAGKASASYIQRRLKIGYNRAARLVEDMEARGIVGPANGSKPRDVIHRP